MVRKCESVRSKSGYAEQFAERVRAAVPDATVTHDPVSGDLIVEQTRVSKQRISLDRFALFCDLETGCFLNEGRPWQLASVPADSALVASGKLPTDATVVGQLMKGDVCLDVAGLDRRSGINYRPELADGAVLCHDYMPTRYELELLAEQWLHQLLTDNFNFFHLGQVGSEWKLGVFALRRLEHLKRELGAEAMQKIESRAQQRLLTDHGNDDLVWLFLFGGGEQHDACRLLCRNVETGAISVGEYRAQLAALRKTAVSTDADSSSTTI